MLRQLRSYVSDRLPSTLRARLLNLESRVVHPFLERVGAAKMFGKGIMNDRLARPIEVDIEVTSGCDADCIMCPRKAMRRRKGPMDLDLFKKIVDECVELGVHGLTLNGYGEISILKNYKDYIGYIRQKSKTIRIGINSNGMRMDEEMSRYYVEQNVSMVNVTIDGATAETFEHVRKHLKLDQVEGNVRRLIQIRNEMKRKTPAVRVGILDMPETHHEIAAHHAKWVGVADEVGIGGLFSRLGSVNYGTDMADWETVPCWLLWTQMPILNDGSVSICCDDWDGETALGNVADNTIKELWTKHTERQRLRQLHLEGRAGEIPVCAGCRQPRKGPWFFKDRKVELPKPKPGSPALATAYKSLPIITVDAPAKPAGLTVLN